MTIRTLSVSGYCGIHTEEEFDTQYYCRKCEEEYDKQQEDISVKLKKAISLLNNIQWSDFGWDKCPQCGESRAQHHEECKLNIFLKEVNE